MDFIYLFLTCCFSLLLAYLSQIETLIKVKPINFIELEYEKFLKSLIMLEAKIGKLKQKINLISLVSKEERKKKKIQRELKSWNAKIEHLIIAKQINGNT